MSYNVLLSKNFKKEAKRLIKKYPSLRHEIVVLGKALENNPLMGIPLGEDVYKIRIAIASKGKGKSGGARVITYVAINDEEVLLLSIYNKGERSTISDAEIKALLDQYK